MVKTKAGPEHHVPLIVTSLFAHLNLLTERIALPKSAINEILWLLGNIKGKTVLEVGCDIGTLTIPLAQAVTERGKVYATDSLESELSIAKVRLKKKYHKNTKSMK